MEACYSELVLLFLDGATFFFWIFYSRLLLELNKLPMKKIPSIRNQYHSKKFHCAIVQLVLVQEVDNFPLYDFSTSTKFLVGNV